MLLISFGSDYNIFLVGRIWEAAQTRTLRQAIISAVPPASATITRAGLALTLTFALLAIIPLKSFQAFAFAMVVGILLDTFFVRSLLAHPHVLRHTFATRFIRRHLDAEGIAALQRLLGHASPKTTMNYVHVTALRLEEHILHLAGPRATLDEDLDDQ